MTDQASLCNLPEEQVAMDQATLNDVPRGVRNLQQRDARRKDWRISPWPYAVMVCLVAVAYYVGRVSKYDCSQCRGEDDKGVYMQLLRAYELIPRDCKEWLELGANTSGMYPIDPDHDVLGVFKVYCDMETDGGGWTVFQRRQDGSVDFYRGWTDYEIGFGKLDNEFWLGLQKIHRLTATASSLRVDMEDFDQNRGYAHYKHFYVDDSSTSYALNVRGYTGDVGDSMSKHNTFKFTTRDKDNDINAKNCAIEFKGAWWYSSCHESNLNGQYLRGPHESHADGVNWLTWEGHGHRYSLKFTEMKLRRS